MRTLMATEVDADLKPPPELAYKTSMRLSETLPELWAARPIVYTLVQRTLKVRYKQSVLGVAWALITPLGMLLVVTVLFHRLAKVSSNGVPYVLFAFVALMCWTFFSGCVNSGATSILTERALLNKGRFPREVFPITTCVVTAVDSLIAMVPLVVLFVVNGFVPAITTPLVILPLIVLAALGVGWALLLSSTTVYVRDIRSGLPLLLQVGLFATPVAYGFELLPQWARMPYSFINPVGPVIDSVRRTVLLGHAPQWGYLGAGAFTAGLMLVIGYSVFKRIEGGFADVG
jgi:ABC-type polysaccharide/polyol phosphate export permease